MQHCLTTGRAAHPGETSQLWTVTEDQPEVSDVSHLTSYIESNNTDGGVQSGVKWSFILVITYLWRAAMSLSGSVLK